MQTRTSSALVLVTLLIAIPAGAGIPTADPDDEPRLLGGEVVAYQFDADDLDTIAPGSVRDASPQGTHGTRLNAPQIVDGPNGFGKALRGSGSSQHVRIDELDGFQTFTSEITISAWIHPETFSGNRVIFSAMSNSVRYMNLYLESSSGDVVVQVARADGNFAHYDFNTRPPLNTWSHLAIVATPTTVSYVRDGETANALQRSGSELYTANAVTAARVLEPSVCCYSSFQGSIDEFRIYDRALTNEEVEDVSTLPYLHPNVAPVADAGPDIALACTNSLTTATLDASGSHDENGDPLTYTWTSPDAHSIAQPDEAITQAIFPLGASTATVRVHDGEFNSSDDVTVHVLDGSPPTLTSVSTEQPGLYTGDQYLPVGGTERVIVANAEITATAQDLCSNIDHVLFQVDDGTVIIDDTAPYGFTYTPFGIGIQYRTLSVTAVDAQGNQSPAVVHDLVVVAGMVG